MLLRRSILVLIAMVVMATLAPAAADASAPSRVTNIRAAQHRPGVVAVRWARTSAARYALRWAPSLRGLAHARVHISRHPNRAVIGHTRASAVYVQVRALGRHSRGPWSAPARVAVRGPATAQASLVRASFADEFNGTSLDTGRWTRETGQGYGQETYTADPSYSHLDGSNLNLECKRVNGAWYAGQVSTRGHFAMNGGTIEFRAKLPTASGFWPGIWVDPSIHGEAGTSTFGEFDILEQFNGMWSGNPGFTTLHYWQNRSTSGTVHAQTQLPMQYNVSDGAFHVWRVTWTRNSIALSIDGNSVGSLTAAQFTANTGHPWPFNNRPAYFVMQLAAMGNGRPATGYPAPSATEAKMVVDYIKILKTA